MAVCALEHLIVPRSRVINRPMPKNSITRLTRFGVELDALLSERGWNQQNLSTATEPNISQGMISNYRSGVRNPSEKTCETLALALVTASDSNQARKQYERIVDVFRMATGKLPLYRSLPTSGDPIEMIVAEAGLTEVEAEELRRFTRLAQRTWLEDRQAGMVNDPVAAAPARLGRERQTA